MKTIAISKHVETIKRSDRRLGRILVDRFCVCSKKRTELRKQASDSDRSLSAR